MDFTRKTEEKYFYKYVVKIVGGTEESRRATLDRIAPKKPEDWEDNGVLKVVSDPPLEEDKVCFIIHYDSHPHTGHVDIMLIEDHVEDEEPKNLPDGQLWMASKHTWGSGALLQLHIDNIIDDCTFKIYSEERPSVLQRCQSDTIHSVLKSMWYNRELIFPRLHRDGTYRFCDTDTHITNNRHARPILINGRYVEVWNNFPHKWMKVPGVNVSREDEIILKRMWEADEIMFPQLSELGGHYRSHVTYKGTRQLCMDMYGGHYELWFDK